MKLNRGIPAALGAAALFGLSTPIAKTLVGEVAPLLLAGLLIPTSMYTTRLSTSTRTILTCITGTIIDGVAGRRTQGATRYGIQALRPIMRASLGCTGEY
jgi:hypothetical protein